jgi:hypothetical protein
MAHGISPKADFHHRSSRDRDGHFERGSGRLRSDFQFGGIVKAGTDNECR